MSKRALVAFTLLLVGMWRVEAVGPIQIETEPLSPSVMSSLAFRDHALAFAVLWRGAPGWFNVTTKALHYSAGNDVLSGNLQYGTTVLRFTRDLKTGITTVGDSPVPMASGQNAVLIDGVGEKSDLRVVGVLEFNQSVDSVSGPNRITQLFASSGDVLSFRRCDFGSGREGFDLIMRSLLCSPHEKPPVK